MVGFLWRFLYTLAGLTPMAFGVFCRDVTDTASFLMGIAASISVVAFGGFVQTIAIRRIRKAFGQSPGSVVPVSVTRQRDGLPTYILAYVLPFLLTTGVTWFVVLSAVVLIGLLSFRKSTIGYNPVADLAGFGFYEVALPSARGTVTVLVVSVRPMLELVRGFKPVRLSEDCFLVF